MLPGAIAKTDPERLGAINDQPPRLPTGKLYRRELRDTYWAGRKSNIFLNEERWQQGGKQADISGDGRRPDC
jgi:hypothetical protein